MLDHESMFSESGPSLIRLSDLLAHCIVALKIAGREIVSSKSPYQQRSKGMTLEGADDIVTGADMRSHKTIVGTIKDTYRRLPVVSEEDTTQDFDDAEKNLLPIGRDKFAMHLTEALKDIESHHVDWGSLIPQHETLVWIDPLDATKEFSENLTEYVTLMACIALKSKPIAGVIYKPFTDKMYWSVMDTKSGKYHHSSDLDEVIRKSRSQPVDSSGPLRVVVSRSHAGEVENILKSSYGSKVRVISAGGSGYKTMEILRAKADAYVHLTHIKKWDICAPHAIISSLGGVFTDLDNQALNFGNRKDQVVTKGIAVSLKQNIHDDILNKLKLLA